MASVNYGVGETLLKIDHIYLSLGGRVILRDVCADVKDLTRPLTVTGQVVCFLGPKGIGKTQLSRIIAGLQEPTSGSVTIEFCGPQRTRKGLVGMVAQAYPLFEWATVEKNLLIAGRQAGLTEVQAHAKMHPYLTQFALDPFLGMYPRQLSGGTRQSVAICQQLMCAGHYLVLDEPFSGLDPNMKMRACELITKVANLDEKNTLIIVTHDVTEGLSVADTVWIMGQEQDEHGAWLPGARIVEQHDLAAQDLCWHPDILQDARFQSFAADIKARFRTLAPQ